MAIPRLIVLHLAPGALATVLFVFIAQPLEAAGYPPVLAFFVAVLAVIIPWELGIVLWAGRRAGGGWLSAIRFREPLSKREWMTVFPAVFVVSLIGFGVLSLFDPAILDAVFGWLPSWFVELVPLDNVAAYSSGAWAVTLIVYAVMNIFVGPFVEELYFRGYLLPRMSQMGKWAPLVNSVLFSLYHFWSPWSLLTRVVGVTPLAYAVWWKRNIYLGMAVHMLLNGLTTTVLIVTVAGKLA
jgi:membrane protease YdiL (CAAX protease family)